MTERIHPDDVEAELQRLEELDLDALKARWFELKGVPLPKFMRRGLMTLAVTHAIKEAAFGGLDPATQKRLDALAAQIVPTGQKPPPKPNRVKAGTRLIREWQGRVHEVTVVDDGFVWNGQRYQSLSAIARLITGTRWNGWVFFGLKRPPAKAGVQLAPTPSGKGAGKKRTGARRNGVPTTTQAEAGEQVYG